MSEHHKTENDSSRTLIEWSEFHYYLLSWLVDETTPRNLAMGIELQLFPTSPYPNIILLEIYINALIESEDATDFTDLARKIYNDNLLSNQKPL